MLLKTLYITFVNEAQTFCERLNEQNETCECSVERDEDWGNKIVLHKTSMNKELINDLSLVLVSVFNSFRLLQIVEKIVRETYYYEDQTEIQRIIELFQEMILEQDKRGWATDKNTRIHNIEIGRAHV